MRLFATLSFLTCTVLLSFCTQAQTPYIEWQKCLGSHGGDYANAIQQTPDGGFIMVGNDGGFDDGDVMGYHGTTYTGDIWLVKTDSKGDIEWQKSLGGNEMEFGESLYQTDDGGFMVVGTTLSKDCNVPGNHSLTADMWVVKTDSKGNIIWQRCYGGTKVEYGYAIDRATDGSYYIGGSSESTDGDLSSNHGLRDFCIIKIDPNGGVIWQKTFGGSQDDELYSLRATPDGGCVAVGYTRSNNGQVTGFHGIVDFWVIKVDANGGLQWQKTLGGSDYDVPGAIQLTQDGGYIVAGEATSHDGDVSANHSSNGGGDFWVVKLNTAGAIQWQKCYGGTLNEIAYNILAANDGSYLVSGSGESFDGDVSCNFGYVDAWVIKIDALGKLIWQKSFGGNSFEKATGIVPLSDGGFMAVGTTCSRDIRGYHVETLSSTCGDYWMVKLSAPRASQPLPTITITPADGNVCPNANVILRAYANYVGVAAKYQWTRNGTILGTDSASYNAVGLANNDMIACTVTAVQECGISPLTATTSFKVRLKTTSINPSVSIVANHTTICPCDPVVVNATVTGAGASPVYQWEINGVPAGNGESLFTSVSLSDGDVITCRLLDNADCIPSGSALSNQIQVHLATATSPDITIATANDHICSGQQTTFIATAGNAGTNPGYQWKINNVDVGINSSKFITSGLVDGDVVTCIITSDPQFVCITSTTSPSNSIVVHVGQQGAPAIEIAASSTSACAGNLVTFTATTTNGGVNPVFQWQVNGFNAGANSSTFGTSSLVNGDIVTCLLAADPSNTCALVSTATSNSIAMTIIQQASPTINIVASDNNVCESTPLSFTATATNAGSNTTYNWQVNNQNSGNTSLTFITSDLKNGDVVTCIILPGSSACSNVSTSSNAITVNINALPVISLTPLDTIVSPGDVVTLHGKISGSYSSFQWQPAGELVDPSSLTATTTALNTSTNFTLTAVSDKGCTATSTAIIKIFVSLYMPTAFTPNSDGKNDVYRIPPNVSLALQRFSIYNRWGTRVFTTTDMSKGWDGMVHGVLAPVGAYVYIVQGTNLKGNVLIKGTFVLVK